MSQHDFDGRPVYGRKRAREATIIRATLHDANGDELETLSFNDATYDDGGVGFNTGFEGNGGVYDYWRLEDQNIVVDGFEDGDISEYTGETGNYNVQQSIVQNGQYAVQCNPSGISWKQIESQSGLNHYPSRGQDFRIWIYADTGTDRALFVMWAKNGGDHYQTGLGPQGDFHLSLSSGTALTGNSYPQDGRWYEILVEW